MLSKLPWLGPLIVFGLVVFVHELGHFLAAKAFGVYAPRFSIGFGPALWRRRFGETEWVLASLPLGGYVRLASREDETTAALEGGSEQSSALAPDDPRYDPTAMIPFGPNPVPANRWFESKPLWQRIVIMIAGVTMNLVLAVLVYAVIAKAEGKQLLDTRVVGSVDTVAVPALAGRIAAGDTIVAVGGKTIETWNDVDDAFVMARGRPLVVTTQRGPVEIDAGEPATKERFQLNGAVVPYVPAVVGSVPVGRPAERAGIAVGDTIVEVAGQPIRTWLDMIRVVSAAPKQTILVVVRRAGGERRFEVTTEAVAEKDSTGKMRDVGKIGVANAPPKVRHEAVGVAGAFREGWRMTARQTSLVLHFLKNLVQRKVSVKELGGPMAIAGASVEAARTGGSQLFQLLAFVSINLAIMNLLPIPILDGGQIVLNVAESVKGRPFSLRTRERIMQAGLLAILLLFVVVMYNDVRRFAGSVVGYFARLFT